MSVRVETKDRQTTAQPHNGNRQHAVTEDSRLPLEAVITTDELRRRSSRPSNYEAENCALVALAQEMANSPQNVLQKLVETALSLCRAHSAGISILEQDDGRKIFRWHAVAGQWRGYLGGTMPREISPCGTVLDRNAMQLMARPERHFPFPPEVAPGVMEVLLIPFHAGGEPVGTIWVVAHDESRQFDAEDARIMQNFGKFAASAYQVLRSLQALKVQASERSEADAAARESERRLREMIDALPVAIYTTDAEGRLTHFNRAAVDFSGRTPELGTDQWCVSWKLYHPDGTPMAHDECPMAIALKEGREVRGAEAIAERPDGKRIWFTPYPTPLRDAEGKITGGINMLLDITERKEAEEALRTSEEYFRALFDLGPVAVYSCDASGVIQQFNHRAVELWGRAPAPGDTDERFCGSHKLFRPDGTYMPHEKCPMAEVIAGRVPAVHDGEVLIERPDASRVTVIVNIRPLKNKQGQITGAINCFYDITERKRAEQAAAWLGAIVDSSDDAIVSKDLDGIITSWNNGAARLFGYTAEETVGKSITMLIPPDRQHEEPQILERVRRGERIDHFETVRMRKDGSLLDISLTISPVKDAAGRIVRFSKIARDITERRRTHTALREAHELLSNKAKQLELLVRERTAKLQDVVGELESFSYTITHDMRAPLRAIQGYISVVKQELAGTLARGASDYLERITASAARLDQLITDVLAYSRTARVELKLSAVNIDRLARGILDSYPGFQAPCANVSIDGKLPPVLGNEAALTQCISNLLDNAVKFVAPGRHPRVRISYSQDDSHVFIHFQDNGIGIDPESHQRIFGMFQRESPKYEGTGIGLAIVKRAVERMAGAVSLTSEPGKGSTFNLRLQRADR